MQSVVDYLVQSFNEPGLTAMDKVAPIKTRLAPLIKSSPWINYNIRSLKRDCRTGECLWKSCLLSLFKTTFNNVLNFSTLLKVGLRMLELPIQYFSNIVPKSQGSSCLFISHWRFGPLCSPHTYFTSHKQSV